MVEWILSPDHWHSYNPCVLCNIKVAIKMTLNVRLPYEVIRSSLFLNFYRVPCGIGSREMHGPCILLIPRVHSRWRGEGALKGSEMWAWTRAWSELKRWCMPPFSRLGLLGCRESWRERERDSGWFCASRWLYKLNRRPHSAFSQAWESEEAGGGEVL